MAFGAQLNRADTLMDSLFATYQNKRYYLGSTVTRAQIMNLRKFYVNAFPSKYIDFTVGTGDLPSRWLKQFIENKETQLDFIKAVIRNSTIIEVTPRKIEETFAQIG